MSSTFHSDTTTSATVPSQSMCDSQFVDRLKVCPFFANQRCKKGRFCRYLHVVNIDRGNSEQQNVPISEENSETTEVSNPCSSTQSGTQEIKQTEVNDPCSSAQSRAGQHEKSVCKHFLYNGWCKFGKNCKFSHIRTKPKKFNAVKNEKHEDVEACASEVKDLSLEGETKVNTVSQGNSEQQNVPISEDNSEMRQTEVNNPCSSAQSGTPEIEQTEVNDPCSSAQSRTGQHENSLCKHFLYNGWCKFGKNCKFSHIRTKHKQFNAVKNEKHEDVEACASEVKDLSLEGETKVNTVSQGNASNVKKSLPTSRIMCRYFKAGYCCLGSRCCFRHVSSGPRKFQSGPSQIWRSVLDKKQTDGSMFSAHSETSSDSGVVEDIGSPYPGSPSIEAISEVDENASMFKQISNDFRRCEKAKPEEVRKQLRKTEIAQVMKRYPAAKVSDLSDDQTAIEFVFMPTDPDWPYDVKEMNLEVIFPAEYPSDMMNIVLTENERMPETVRRLVTEAIQDWVNSRFKTMKTCDKADLAFRPFLKWFDTNAEDVLTDALKEFRRERLAEIAGVQFISADQLRSKYKSSADEPGKSLSDSNAESSNAANSVTVELTEYENSSDEETEKVEEEHSSDVDNPSKTVTAESLGLPERRGTEVILQNLQLLNSAATLIATNVMLIISCGRCTNKSELKTKAGQVNRIECPYCHGQQLAMFRSSVAHQFSSIIGYLDLEGCDAFDLVLTDCQFIVNCLECSKDNKILALPPGPPNTTWCHGCHQRLTLAVNNARFVKFAATVQIESKNACVVDVKSQKPVKSVKDPAICEGKPLPDNGTCKHFKKSFRWFRFPCCGKAYPCDICHAEKELPHEMKLANRMICGYCAKEQPCASERPCMSCHANLTFKATAHWEGGTGCRDKLKMSRGDSKKYKDSNKTASKSSQTKTESNKKVIKLRHL